jgi:hypothetical protein
VDTEGTIVVPGTSNNGEQTISGVLFIKPDEQGYEFWRWVVANRELFPEINNENAAAVVEAFEQLRIAEESERKVAPDHGLPDPRA